MEKWSRIEGFKDYAISDQGRVYSHKSDIFMKVSVNNCGYTQVCFSQNNKRSVFGIHTLIAQAFIPNPQNKKEINHIDRNKLNNEISNLEWATKQENIDHYWNSMTEQEKIEREERRLAGFNQAIQKRTEKVQHEPATTEWFEKRKKEHK